MLSSSLPSTGQTVYDKSYEILVFFYQIIVIIIKYFIINQEEIEGIKTKNQGVLGKFKDELNGNIMSKFIGLRAKSYYYDSWDPINKVEIKSKKKNKGTKSSVVECVITGEDYEKCIFDKKKKIIKQNLIQFYKHNLHSITQKK